MLSSSLPLGAERIEVRWGIPMASEHAHLTLPPLRGGPLPLPPMSGEGKLVIKLSCVDHRTVIEARYLTGA